MSSSGEVFPVLGTVLILALCSGGVRSGKWWLYRKKALITLSSVTEQKWKDICFSALISSGVTVASLGKGETPALGFGWYLGLILAFRFVAGFWEGSDLKYSQRSGSFLLPLLVRFVRISTVKMSRGFVVTACWHNGALILGVTYCLPVIFVNRSLTKKDKEAREAQT